MVQEQISIAQLISDFKPLVTMLLCIGAIALGLMFLNFVISGVNSFKLPEPDYRQVRLEKELKEEAPAAYEAMQRAKKK